jgi:hypothetical protein
MPSKRRPAKRSKGWEASLAHVVTIMRGPTLKTLAEARAYILKLPKAKQSSHVAPHTTSNGTYVSGHQQTNPNGTQLDNYGTRGNVNPHTGAVGTRGAQY